MKYMASVLLLVAAMSAQNASSTNKGRHLDVPTISREANGAIVSIVMSNKDGHPIAQGSGFLISKDGHVVTNYHVIKSGTSAVVKLPNGTFFAVDGVLASDKNRDVAIIKAHGVDFRTLTLGDSDRLQVGEEVVAIGNPLSLESTVSNGIVSAIRTVEDEGGKFLQITAPIAPGSSGGPLFNMAGEAVGITTSHLVGGQNLNFAVPINDVKPLFAIIVSSPHPFPDEAEDDEVAAGRDPIVLDDESEFERQGKRCNPETKSINCQFINRRTGIIEAFATDPSCHGITVLPMSHMPAVKWPDLPYWSLDVSWLEWYEPAPCSNPAAEGFSDIKGCFRKQHDGTLHWHFEHVVKADNKFGLDAIESGDSLLPSTSIEAGVKTICALIAGPGANIK